MFGIFKNWRNRSTIMSTGSQFISQMIGELAREDNPSVVVDRGMRIIWSSGKAFVTDIHGRRHFLSSGGEQIDVLESVFKNRSSGNYEDIDDKWKDHFIIWAQGLRTKAGIWRTFVLLSAALGLYSAAQWVVNNIHSLWQAVDGFVG